MDVRAIGVMLTVNKQKMLNHSGACAAPPRTGGDLEHPPPAATQDGFHPSITPAPLSPLGFDSGHMHAHLSTDSKGEKSANP